MRNQKHQEAKWKALLWSKGPQERRSRGDQGTEQRAGSSRERPGDLGHPRRAGRVGDTSASDFSLQSVIDQRAGPAKAGTSTDWQGFKLAKQVKQPGREKQSFPEPLTVDLQWPRRPPSPALTLPRAELGVQRGRRRMGGGSREHLVHLPSCACTSGLLDVSQSLPRPRSAVLLKLHNHCFLQCSYSLGTKLVHCPSSRKESKIHLLHNSDSSQQAGRLR